MNKHMIFRCDDLFIARVKKLCEVKGIKFSKLVKDYLEKEMKKHKI